MSDAPVPAADPAITKDDLDKAVKNAVTHLKRDHNAKVKGLNQALADTRSREVVATQNVERLREENRKLHETVEPLRKDLSRSRKDLAGAEAQVATLKADLSNARKDADTAHRRGSQLEGATILIQRARDAAQQDLRGAEQARVAAEAARDVARGEAFELREKVKDLEKTLRDAKIAVAQKG